MKITVNEHIHLSEFQPSDQVACVEHLREKEIYDRTLRIPYPYTEADFQEWLKRVEKTKQEQGRTFLRRQAQDETRTRRMHFPSYVSPLWRDAVKTRRCYCAFPSIALKTSTPGCVRNNRRRLRTKKKLREDESSKQPRV